jgi:hypothetical protein
MSVPQEWLSRSVSYNVNRPVQTVWDDGMAIGMTHNYVECYLENVPFSDFEKTVFEQLGSDKVTDFLPNGCYGDYRVYTSLGSVNLEWTRLYLTGDWIGEFLTEIGNRRARQEAF